MAELMFHHQAVKVNALHLLDTWISKTLSNASVACDASRDDETNSIKSSKSSSVFIYTYPFRRSLKKLIKRVLSLSCICTDATE